MVEFVHPLAWAVTAEDAAKAITGGMREMRNLMLPPKFVPAFSFIRIRARRGNRSCRNRSSEHSIHFHVLAQQRSETR
jgi:hypothetical protein